MEDELRGELPELRFRVLEVVLEPWSVLLVDVTEGVETVKSLLGLQQRLFHFTFEDLTRIEIWTTLVHSRENLNRIQSFILDISITPLQVHYYSEAPIGRFEAFRLNVCGFNSRSSRHVGTLGKSFNHSCLWRFGMKLWHSIRAVTAVSGAPPSSSGLEEVL